MSENKITVTATLADEDRDLLKKVMAALKASTSGAGATPGKTPEQIAAAKKKAAAAAKAAAEADDGDDGDADDGEGDDGDADDGEGDADDGPDLDAVTEAMKKYATAPGSSKAKAMALLKKTGGVEALSKLKPAKFAAVIDGCKAAIKKAKAAAAAAAADDGDDE